MKTSLFLAWLSHHDFNQLLKEDNFALLEEILKEQKNSLSPYFKNQAVSLDKIIKDFDKITLTTNPKIAFGYDFEREILLYNLWLFLFEPCGGFASSSFPASFAGHLFYQYNIHLSLKKNGVIGKPKDVKAVFQKEHGLEIDKQAVQTHIDFLEKTKTNDLLPIVVDLVKVTSWSPEGRPNLSSDSEMYMTPKTAIVALIDDLIKQQSKTLSEMVDKHYSKSTDESNSQMVLELSKALSLPLKSNTKKSIYPEITISF
jgi:hypothetical protein